MSRRIIREERLLDQQREAQTIQGIIDGKSAGQSMLDAGFGVAVSRTPRKFLEGRGLRRRVQRELNEADATIATMAQAVSGALKANVDDKADHKVRLGAAKVVAELFGVAPDRGGMMATQVIINMPAAAGAWFESADDNKG